MGGCDRSKYAPAFRCSLLRNGKKVYADFIPIIVTGLQDENLIIDAVRKVRIFDYVRKPWDADDLEMRIQKAFDAYQESANWKSEREEFKNTVTTLKNKLEESENKIKNFENLKEELEAWVPPSIVWALANNELKFPQKRDLAVVTYDIIDSSRHHGRYIEGKTVRSLILKMFTEVILKNGGWR